MCPIITIIAAAWLLPEGAGDDALLCTSCAPRGAPSGPTAIFGSPLRLAGRACSPKRCPLGIMHPSGWLACSRGFAESGERPTKVDTEWGLRVVDSFASSMTVMATGQIPPRCSSKISIAEHVNSCRSGRKAKTAGVPDNKEKSTIKTCEDAFKGKKTRNFTTQGYI